MCVAEHNGLAYVPPPWHVARSSIGRQARQH